MTQLQLWSEWLMHAYALYLYCIQIRGLKCAAIKYSEVFPRDLRAARCRSKEGLIFVRSKISFQD